MFTGIGGLDFGFEAAGFKTAVALELDPTACRTIRLNRDWPLLEGKIQDYATKQILKAGGIRVGEADVLIGGPPCQPFSKAGYWVRGDAPRLSDPRSDTLVQYLRVLKDAQPKAFLLENVPGLAFDSKNEGFQFLLDGVASINRAVGTNYQISHQVLNAADYGVPQLRERIFLIGSRDGKKFEFPPQKFFSPDDEDNRLPAHRTCWDAIGDLQSLASDPSLEIGGKWGKLLPSIPEGNNYLWHTPRGGGSKIFGWRTRYWSFLLKLAKNRPSWTIQAQPGTAIGPFHWLNRRLSATELCRLQTFPDGLLFDCGRTEVQRLLGNAVPSLLAETLAWEIRLQFLGGTRAPKQMKLLPQMRPDIPAPESISPVPLQYIPLIGDHADHPGTGKGKGAVARTANQTTLLDESTKSKAA